MTNRTHEVWFPAKRYGFGWGLPVRWQGWVVVIAYWLGILGGAFTYLQWTHRAYFIAYLVGISVVFVAVCAWKGEPLRWRWGKE